MAYFGYAQAPPLGSLRTAAHDRRTPDSLRIQALGDLARAYAGSGMEDSALITARELVTFSARKGAGRRTALAQGLLGTLHAMTGSYDSARYYHEAVRSFHRAAKDTVQEAEAELSIGYSYHLQGRFPQALEHALRGLALAEQTRDSATLAHCEVNVSAIYIDTDRPEEALEHLDRAIAVMRATGDPRIRNALGQAGMLHAKQGDLDKGSALTEEALAICENIGDMPTASRLLQMMGNIKNQQGRYADALADLERSSANTRSAYTLIQNRIAKAMALDGLGRPSEALPLLKEAAQMAEEGEDLADASDAYKEMAGIYERTGKGALAYDALKRHIALRDSITNEDKVQEITRSEMNYAFGKQQLADSLRHDAAITLAATEAREQRRMRNGFVIAFALLAIITALLFWSLRTTRRKNAEILHAQQQVVEAEKQRENEQVRTRIARDIHDEIGSGLTKIALLGSEAKRRLQDSTEELRTTLDRIVGHSREVSAALSDIVWTTDPQHDTSEELVNHARNVAHRLLDGSGTAHDLDFLHTDPGHSVAPGTKYHVVMVMKEAIHNALKYADAGRITVKLTAGAHHVLLVVADDGQGFDPEAQARAGNGLRNLRARGEAIGADLTVESIPGKGSTVRLEGPLL